MTLSRRYTSLAVFAMLVNPLWAGGKRINGLSFQLSGQPKAQCSQAFYVWHVPDDPFFRDLKQVKSKRTLQYRRGQAVVESFPNSTTVIVEFWQMLHGLSACSAFDPERAKFQVQWRNGSQTLPAKANFALAGKSLPESWCEDKCTVRWTYKLTIDSQNVPLQDNLLLRIETEDGSALAGYVGRLSTDPPLMPPLVH